MLRRFSRTALLLAAGAAFVPGTAEPAAAQAIGSVAGSVSLEGAGLPGIAVDLEGEGTALSTVTDAAGGYVFSGIMPGSYTMTLPGLPQTLWAEHREWIATVQSGERVVRDLAVQRTPVITISVVPDSARGARVMVSPNPLYIVPGQRILWQLDKDMPPESVGPFTVHFEPLSPLIHRRMHVPAGETILGEVRDLILPGKYRYFVAVWYDGLIYTEDPDLIDDNGGRGGPGGGT